MQSVRPLAVKPTLQRPFPCLFSSFLSRLKTTGHNTIYYRFVSVCGTGMGAETSGALVSEACRLVVYFLMVGIDAATSSLRNAVGRRGTTSGMQQVPTRSVGYYGIHGNTRSF